MDRAGLGFGLLASAWQHGPGCHGAAADTPAMPHPLTMSELAEPASAHVPGRAAAPLPLAGTTVAHRVLLVKSAVRAEALLCCGLLASARCKDRVYRIDSVVANSLDGLEHLCGALAPRVLVIDVALLGMVGTDALKHHRRRLPATEWMLAWETPTADQCALAVRSRAHGSVEWAQGGRQLVQALDAVLAGELWFTPTVLQSLYLALLEQGPQASAPADVEPAECALTSRESEVLACMRHGLSNKQIAGRLEISVNTVKKHLAHVYEKRGLHNGRQTFA